LELGSAGVLWRWASQDSPSKTDYDIAADSVTIGTCLHVLVERFCTHAANAKGAGLIVAESRGRVLDKSIAAAWRCLQTSDPGQLEGTDIRGRVKALVMRPKNRNIAGLQLADLVVAPIARHVLGRECHEDYRSWSASCSEIRKETAAMADSCSCPKKKVRTRYAVPNLRMSIPLHRM
jgi:hypothetical protein